MKRLYARLVLWLIGPALELRCERDAEIFRPVIQYGGDEARREFMDRLIKAGLEKSTHER